MNKVDLPTLGRPTMPIDRLTRASLVAVLGTRREAATTVRSEDLKKRVPGPGVSPGGYAHRMRSSLHMSAISLLFGLLLGIVVGAAIGFLYARGRLAAATADASARARAAEQRAALVDGHLAERFEALSAQALDARAPARVSALNRVDLPTLGRPTMPIDRLTCASLVARGAAAGRPELLSPRPVRHKGLDLIGGYWACRLEYLHTECDRRCI